eukprot:10319969-Ditylum_brightwellii.AAC.1
MDVLFFRDTYNPIQDARRRLIATNPVCHEKYMDTLSESFKAHNVYNKAMDLKKDVKTGTIAINQGANKYNRLDKQITELMICLENHCRKGQHGYAWSLKLVAAT